MSWLWLVLALAQDTATAVIVAPAAPGGTVPITTITLGLGALNVASLIGFIMRAGRVIEKVEATEKSLSKLEARYDAQFTALETRIDEICTAAAGRREIGRRASDRKAS